MELTSKQRRFLRALAHPLKPAVLVGKEGVTEALVEKVSIELERHELIKVKFTDSSDVDAREGGAPLAEATKAGLAQVIGRTAVLYRRRSKKPDIKLPKEPEAKPAKK